MICHEFYWKKKHTQNLSFCLPVFVDVVVFVHVQTFQPILNSDVTLNLANKNWILSNCFWSKFKYTMSRVPSTEQNPKNIDFQSDKCNYWKTSHFYRGFFFKTRRNMFFFCFVWADRVCSFQTSYVHWAINYCLCMIVAVDRFTF